MFILKHTGEIIMNILKTPFPEENTKEYIKIVKEKEKALNEYTLHGGHGGKTKKFLHKTAEHNMLYRLLF